MKAWIKDPSVVWSEHSGTNERHTCDMCAGWIAPNEEHWLINIRALGTILYLCFHDNCVTEDKNDAD